MKENLVGLNSSILPCWHVVIYTYMYTVIGMSVTKTICYSHDIQQWQINSSYIQCKKLVKSYDIIVVVIKIET